MFNDKKHDPQELTKLYDETISMIYNLGLRLFKHEEAAMDFSQDVYEQAFAKLNQFDGRSKFSTWLYSLAMNLGLSRLRKEKHFSYDEVNWEQVFSQEQKSMGVEIEEEEEAKLIQTALALLPDAYRLPIILFYYEHFSYQEISQKLGIKEGTVKSNIHRGKTQLRELLAKAGLQK